jgi:hypothetical protein
LDLLCFVNQFDKELHSKIFDRSGFVVNSSTEQALSEAFLEAVKHGFAILTGLNPNRMQGWFDYYASEFNVAEYRLKVYSIRVTGEAIMIFLIWGTRSVIEYTTEQMSLPKAKGKQKLLNYFGILKNRLFNFKEIPNSTFYLHLKECEFWFNHRKRNIYMLLSKMFREKPLNQSIYLK